MEIIIVGGFLGSGKTTTLNHLIKDALNHDLKLHWLLMNLEKWVSIVISLSQLFLSVRL